MPATALRHSLLDKSLLRQVEGADGEPRFTMLETIREYALEQLAASGEAEVLRRQHAAYYLALAEGGGGTARTSEREWLDRLESEHDNLRAALQWMLDQGETALGIRLAGALGHFWSLRGYVSEGRMWLRRALAGNDAVTADRARALHAWHSTFDWRTTPRRFPCSKRASAYTRRRTIQPG